MKYSVRIPVVCFVWTVVSLTGNSQTTDIISSDAFTGKSYGQLAEATLESRENFFRENYFFQRYPREEMKGTGYKQFLRLK